MTNQPVQTPSPGEADWDTTIDGNRTVFDRGFHIQLTAGEPIGSGEIIYIDSGSVAKLYNASSLDLKHPGGISYKSINSGEADHFLMYGAVRSLDAVSGNMVVGKDVYVSPTSPGVPVSSYSAAAYPVGIAIDDTGVFVRHGLTPHEELISITQSMGLIEVESTHHAAIDIGHRGIVRVIEFVSESHDLWTARMYSGSAAVNSELLYETISGGVNSIYGKDAALFPYYNTDTASPGMIFLQVTPHSNSVLSGHFNVNILAERFR